MERRSARVARPLAMPGARRDSRGGEGVSPAGFEQRLLSTIDPRRMHEDLDRLARFSLRLGGTEQEGEAAQYVCGRLREAGVDARLEAIDAFVSHGADPMRFGTAFVEVRDGAP